jgi:hypothetical protein
MAAEPMTVEPVKRKPGAGILMGTAYFITFILVVPQWINYSVSFDIPKTFGIPLPDVYTHASLFHLIYILVSLMTGLLFIRVKTGTLLLIGAVLSGLSALGYTVAPTWGFVEAMMAIEAVGRPILLTGLILVCATHLNRHALVWLFASNRVSSIISVFLPAGPYLVGFINWHSGFLIATIVHGIVIALLLATRPLWNLLGQDQDNEDNPPFLIGTAIRMPLVWIGIGMFAVVGILETTTVMNGWIPLDELVNVIGVDALKFSRALQIVISAISVIVFGVIFYQRKLYLAVCLCLIGVLFGIVLVRSQPVGWLTEVGMMLKYFAISPVLLLLLIRTKHSLPTSYLPFVISLQLIASQLGNALPHQFSAMLFSAETNTVVSLICIVLIFILISVWLNQPKKKKRLPEIEPVLP